MNTLSVFSSSAKSLARNPLGIIALFIVLIYGFAALVVGASDKLQGRDRIPLVWFLVVFPVLVLGEFGWLVSKHHMKLYAPSDYKSDDAFIQAYQLRITAAAALGAAAAKSGGEGPGDSARAVALVIQNAVTADAVESSRHATVLWVDDRPENNRFERQSLEALGIKFVGATTTDHALRQISEQSFDAIISDMARPPDEHAGYTLLDQLRARGDKTPYVIYAGSNVSRYASEAKQHGAFGCTNRPDELFQLVLTVINPRRGTA
jgi:CheY-like chemotaxis protein